MDSTARTVAKAVSWQLSGIVVMSAIGYAMTGSFGQASGFALLTAAIGFVTFFLHERLWARIRWGRRPAER
ncbi:MAG: DUF2061 domain-containing protein [Pseudomonadota bacterium]